MYNDKIEISYPNGLINGISKDEYLDGRISILRNPILGNVFFRLKYIEKFGTGVLRIKTSYKEYEYKPEFKIYDNSITVILPVINLKAKVSTEEYKILEYLKKGRVASSSELQMVSGFSKNKVLRLLDSLIDKNYVKSIGVGRGKKYTV